MAFETILNRPGVYRLLLEPRVEGVYVNVFTASGECSNDWLQSDLEMAMRQCEQEFNVAKSEWVEVPNEPLHFDSTEDQEPRFSFKIDENGMPIVE